MIFDMMDDYDEVVSKHWGQMAKKENDLFNWNDSIFVQEYVNNRN